MGRDTDAFADGERIPTDHTCDGAGTAPALEWSGVPDGAAELVLIMEDAEAAATGGEVAHWIVGGIDTSSDGIAADEPPEGAVVGANDLGDRAYAAPCPPEGEEPREYWFTLFAIDEPSGFDEDANAMENMAAVGGNEIDRARLVGTYGR